MPTFAYTGRTRAGQTVSGERVADTIDAATAALRREQINVTRITPVAAPAADAKAKEKKGTIGKKVAAKPAVFSTRFSSGWRPTSKRPSSCRGRSSRR